MICVSAVRNRLPKLWPLSPRPDCEAVLKEPGKQAGILAQRHHAVADVARRQHVELPPQTAADCRHRRSP